MAKADVWMPLYIGDYYRDTRRLTTEQHGAYILLTMDYWTNGPPPDDPVVLAQITGLTPDAWSMHQAMLKRFFKVIDGHWRHKRIDEELVKANDNQERRSAKAKAGAEARWGKAKPDAPSMPQALPEGCASPSPSPTVEDKPSTVSVARKRAPTKRALPADWTPEKFADGTKSGAIVANWPAPRWVVEVERFRSHHRSRASMMADWQSAWATWVLNSAKFDKQGGNNDRKDTSRTADAAEHAFGPASGWDSQGTF